MSEETPQEKLTRQLCAAARAGDISTAANLLLAGANINRRQIQPATAYSYAKSLDNPLGEAISYNQLPMAEYLLANGADIHATANHNDHSALEYARAQKGKYGIKALLEKANIEQIAKTTQEWSLIGTTKLAHVEFSPVHSLKLTSIFNFESRQYSSLTENLAAGTTTPFPAVNFEDLPPQLIERALETFSGLGGEADKEFVMSGRITARKRPRPERSIP